MAQFQQLVETKYIYIVILSSKLFVMFYLFGVHESLGAEGKWITPDFWIMVQSPKVGLNTTVLWNFMARN